MIQIINKADCSGCHACFNVCPQKAIIMKEDPEGFLYPSVGKECIDCGICEKICPFVSEKKENVTLCAVGAKCKDSLIRKNSSSGGIFSLVAEQILSENGIIVGASFSDDWKTVFHTETDINHLRTSKYVQSKVGNSMQRVKILLEQGRKVLFTGTPCQIAGLKNFLGKDYSNLFCMDIVCHGVPSPKVWYKYTEFIERFFDGIICEVNFRKKKDSQLKFGISKIKNTTKIFIPKDLDPYLTFFLNNLSLRPSCYSCKIKETGSGSDITLGDFWGVQNILPDFNDRNGCSLVIIHSLKGVMLFNKIKDDIYAQNIDINAAKKYNSSLYKSAIMPENRESFFIDLQKISFERLILKYSTILKKVLSRSFNTLKANYFTKTLNGKEMEYGLYLVVKNLKKQI